LIEPLRGIEEQRNEEAKMYKQILDLMSCEKVVITGMAVGRRSYFFSISCLCVID